MARALHGAVAQSIEAVRATGAVNPVVIIDGQSGAGKSTIARALVAHWPLRGRVQLVALDSLYPGWDGLDAGVKIAHEQILVPHARGLIGVWQRWDWDAAQSAEAHAVDPALPLIVEGSGILTPVTARLADVCIWVESTEASRKHRALDRDGDTYAPHWDRWARQERAHQKLNHPRDHANLTFVIP